MASFDILNAEQNIDRNTILEASAGTGKTFSIENLVVRLILEKDISVERILIVTFTKASTRDLRVRVRKNIMQAIVMLKGKANPFDYIKSHLEHSESMVRRLQRALLLFDNAAINTIHGFCFNSLRENLFDGNMSLKTQYEGDQPGKTIYLKIIRDYFRTGMNEEDFSPAQLKRVANRGVQELEKQLLGFLMKPAEVVSTKPFSQSFVEFQNAFNQIKLNGDELRRYHEAYGHNYKKLKDKDIDLWIERFAECTGTAADFEFLIKEGLQLINYYDKENLRKRPTPPPHPDLELNDRVLKYLVPIVNEARSVETILARMIHSIQKMVNNYLKEEEMWRFDDLLSAMQESIHKPLFNNALREKYDAVIVDEFQDTDPIQWNIFSSLYVTDEWKGHIYIVGDPKQSIYAFRTADIYTYLNAVDQIGQDACATLDINYRSHPQLIEELNLFFSADHLFHLPENGKYLNYKNVQASDGKHLPLIEDGKGTLQFFVAEQKGRFSFNRVLSEQFLPYVAEEINRLRKSMPLNSIAILVRKNKEAEMFADFLRKQNIGAHLFQTASLSESIAVKGLKDIIAAAVEPRNLVKARVALAGVLLGRTNEQILQLEPEKALTFFHELHRLPVIHFMQRVLEESAKNLLAYPDGYKVYEDLVHLIELVITRQALTPMNLEGLSDFISELALMEFEGDESLKRQGHSEEDAVQILTLHSSKGLEFDVVFAVGLATPGQEPKLLVPNRAANCIEAVLDKEDARYILHCEEEDAEKMRLLYVAMTRAKRRVYVPYIKHEKPRSVKSGQASCMEIYSAINPSFLRDFSSEVVDGQITAISNPREQYSLTPPPRLIIPWRDRFLYSFTSLVKNKPHQEGEFDPPHDFACLEKTIHTLPAGAETGTFLHELFEKLPFAGFNSEEFLDSQLMHSIYKPWRDVLLKLLNHVKELPCFIGVESHEVYREVEFLYPTDHGLLKGVIDLVFRKDGRYYLLDWKSNWLGPNGSHYTHELLDAAMKHHEYELQASIYAEALRRYLGVLDDRTFEECFGGVYYVFLRGLDSASDKAGVLHFLPKMSPAAMKQA